MDEAGGRLGLSGKRALVNLRQEGLGPVSCLVAQRLLFCKAHERLDLCQPPLHLDTPLSVVGKCAEGGRVRAVIRRRGGEARALGGSAHLVWSRACTALLARRDASSLRSR